jgi:hypothetical protein
MCQIGMIAARSMKTLSVGLAACAVLAAACGRPAPKPGGTAPSTVPVPGPAAPSKPAPGGSELAGGLGNVHHPIKTSSSEAQKFFDQGVALTFGFNHEAAIRSFERAQQIDPKAAMAYWGEAWALGTNYNMSVDDPREKLAFDKISQARTLAADGPQIERDYIDAMARRYRKLRCGAEEASCPRELRWISQPSCWTPESHGPGAHTTLPFNSGGVPWQVKTSCRMTSRRRGITRCASRSAPRC